MKTETKHTPTHDELMDIFWAVQSIVDSRHLSTREDAQLTARYLAAGLQPTIEVRMSKENWERLLAAIAKAEGK